MVITQDKLCLIVDLLRKMSKDSMTLEEIEKKVQNREINLLIENDEINLLEPNLLSGFFIRNVLVDVDFKVISEQNPYFDLDMLVSIKKINNFNFELTDINNKKLKVHKDKIKVSLRKVPLDTFLNLIV